MVESRTCVRSRQQGDQQGPATCGQLRPQGALQVGHTIGGHTFTYLNVMCFQNYIKRRGKMSLYYGQQSRFPEIFITEGN